MTLLAQARIEANDTASVPPLVMVKREQVIDILGHLEPFGEALQVREKSQGKPPIIWMKLEYSEGTNANSSSKAPRSRIEPRTDHCSADHCTTACCPICEIIKSYFVGLI